MEDKRYEEHKKRCREYQRGAGRINAIARKEALKLLIKKHRKEFDNFIFKLKEELKDEINTHK